MASEPPQPLCCGRAAEHRRSGGVRLGFGEEQPVAVLHGDYCILKKFKNEFRKAGSTWEIFFWGFVGWVCFGSENRFEMVWGMLKNLAETRFKIIFCMMLVLVGCWLVDVSHSQPPGYHDPQLSVINAPTRRPVGRGMVRDRAAWRGGGAGPLPVAIAHAGIMDQEIDIKPTIPTATWCEFRACVEGLADLTFWSS